MHVAWYLSSRIHELHLMTSLLLCIYLQFQCLRRRELAAAKLRMLIAKLDHEFDRAILQVRLKECYVTIRARRAASHT